MRRHLLIPLLAAALVVAACGNATSAAPGTVTKIVTATGTPPAQTGSSGITVVAPSGTGATGSTAGSAAPTGSGAATGTGAGDQSSGATGDQSSGATGDQSSGASGGSTSAASSSAPVSTGPVVKVDPLHVACTSLLEPSDINKALGATVSSASSRIVDVANPAVKMTGRVKCYYGVKTGSDDRPVAVALAQYASAAAAQSQLDVTVQSETGLGAQVSTVTVSGNQAHVLVRDGGLLVLRYDTWTLSIAVDKSLAAAGELPDGLQKLATVVLARVLKSG